MMLIGELIYLTIIFIAVIIGCRVRQKLNKALKGVLLLLAITLLCESSALICVIYMQTNLPIYYLFFFSKSAILGYVYFQLLKKKRDRTIIACLCTTALLMIVFITIQSSFPILLLFNIEGTFMLVCSLLYFKELLRQPIEGNILRFSFFWLNCAVLYFCIIEFLCWGILELVTLPGSFILFPKYPIMTYSQLVYYAAIALAFVLNKKAIT